MSAYTPAHAFSEASRPATGDHKRRKLRVAIVTENFLPKVDGVTRTLARLLEHLNAEGHEAIVFGPETGMRQYAGHDVVGTFGLPLIVYPGLKLNFTRPRFIRRLQQFRPDVVHFVDPIWLGAQMLPIVQKWLPSVPCVSSYHTNLPTYATLFGMPWLEDTMWKLTRNLHARCKIVFCPSESTRRMLRGKGFENVEIWSRGVDTTLFTPDARDDALRASWGCTPKPTELVASLSSHDTEDLALVQLANKMGVQISRKSPQRVGGNRDAQPARGSPSDESFIRTPPTGPLMPMSSPEMSPPPAYDSVAGIPDIPNASFSLPPPAMSLHTADSAAFQEKPSKTVILYVGRISWEKNIRLLIEAFKMLPAPVRNLAKLVFVGDGPARGDLTRLCKKYKLDATFMGHQKGKRLAAMYASASVFAFPSFTETFGQVVLEALASGLPVVGLHAEGTSDLVSHGMTGFLLDVKSAAGGSLLASSTTPSSSPRKGNASAGNLLVPQSPRLVSLRERGKMASKSTSRVAMTEFVEAAAAATAGMRPAIERRSSAMPATGLPTAIPSVAEFAACMSSTSSSAFVSCARSYSMLLERLIQDRPLRAAMGQRAQLGAAQRTWWDAMDAVVCGYEQVVASNGLARLSDDELEAIRLEQQKVSPLTGPRIRALILLYTLVILIWCLALCSRQTT